MTHDPKPTTEPTGEVANPDLLQRLLSSEANEVRLRGALSEIWKTDTAEVAQDPELPFRIAKTALLSDQPVVDGRPDPATCTCALVTAKRKLNHDPDCPIHNPTEGEGTCPTCGRRRPSDGCRNPKCDGGQVGISDGRFYVEWERCSYIDCPYNRPVHCPDSFHQPVHREGGSEGG